MQFSQTGIADYHRLYNTREDDERSVENCMVAEPHALHDARCHLPLRSPHARRAARLVRRD